MKFDTPIDRALLLGSLVIAVVREGKRVSCGRVRSGVIHIQTFPGVNNRDSVINHDITIRLVASSERKKIFPYISGTFRERNREVDKIELYGSVVCIIGEEVTYIQVI